MSSCEHFLAKPALSPFVNPTIRTVCLRDFHILLRGKACSLLEIQFYIYDSLASQAKISSKMSDHNNTSASQGQPAPAPASDAPNLEDTSPEVFLQAAHTAAGALCEIYRIILRVDSFENATQADMDVVHHEIWGILQGVNTPIDGLPADAQEDLRRVLRRASVLPGVRRFAPALGITARPGLDDSVTVPVGLIPGWDYPVQPGRPHLSQAEADVR